MAYRESGDFKRFWEETKHEWVKLAASALNSLGAPPTIDVDDVLQVMMMACTRFVFEWDPKRGPNLRTHVIWRSYDKAVKFVHKERRTGRSDPKIPRSGRATYDVCFSSLVSKNSEQHEAEELLAAIMPTVEPTQEQTIARRSLFRKHDRSGMVVSVFVRSRDLETTVGAALGCQRTREEFELDSIDTAPAKVMKVISNVVQAHL